MCCKKCRENCFIIHYAQEDGYDSEDTVGKRNAPQLREHLCRGAPESAEPEEREGEREVLVDGKAYDNR